MTFFRTLRLRRTATLLLLLALVMSLMHLSFAEAESVVGKDYAVMQCMFFLYIGAYPFDSRREKKSPTELLLPIIPFTSRSVLAEARAGTLLK